MAYFTCVYTRDYKSPMIPIDPPKTYRTSTSATEEAWVKWLRAIVKNMGLGSGDNLGLSYWHFVFDLHPTYFCFLTYKNTFDRNGPLYKKVLLYNIQQKLISIAAC